MFARVHLRALLLLPVALCACPGLPLGSPAEPPEPEPPEAVGAQLRQALQDLEARRYPEALQAADRALEAARAGPSRAGEAHAQRTRARALLPIGRAEEAAGAWRLAAQAWERAGDGPGPAQALAYSSLLSVPAERAEAASALASALSSPSASDARPRTVPSKSRQVWRTSVTSPTSRVITSPRAPITSVPTPFAPVWRPIRALKPPA